MALLTVLNPPSHGTMPEIGEYLTTDEAAKKLGFHVISVRQMLRSNKLFGIKVGNVWLVSKASLKEYQEKTAGMEKNDPRRGQS